MLLPITEVVTSNEFFDYDALYNGQVQEITPARIAPELAERVSKITSHNYDILHCNGIIRIDYTGISPEVESPMLEVNTTPRHDRWRLLFRNRFRAAGLGDGKTY